jgi:hypothetical protein
MEVVRSMKPELHFALRVDNVYTKGYFQSIGTGKPIELSPCHLQQRELGLSTFAQTNRAVR